MSKLSIEKLYHKYDNSEVISNVSFSVNRGEIACILGPSGCGKTTLLEVIAGIKDTQQGSITLDGKHIHNVALENRRIGIVFQEPSLFPHLNVLENIIFALEGNTEISQKREIAQQYLAKVHMQNFANCYPHTLSGGQQQRVAIARSLAYKPLAMLMDEPFANLDPILREDIRQEGLAILKKANIPIILVTHDPEEALRMGDKICILQNGGLVQQGSAKELYDKPKSEFVANLFGELNSLSIKDCIDGVASTIFGELKLKNTNNDKEVTLYFRPEDVLINEPSAGVCVEARVENIRFLGLTSLLYVCICNENTIFKARVLSNQLPSLGEKVRLSLRNYFTIPLNQ